MTIDLLKIAEDVAQRYKDVELSCGVVRIYHVPDPAIWTYELNRPRPERPVIKMRLATGQTQNRPIKEGDESWKEWLKKDQTYSNDLSELRLAARYVLALKDITYPDITQSPPAFNKSNGNYPDNDILRKRIWLDYSILAISTDMAIVQAAMAELNGINLVTDDMVNEVKKNSESELEG